MKSMDESIFSPLFSSSLAVSSEQVPQELKAQSASWSFAVIYVCFHLFCFMPGFSNLKPMLKTDTKKKGGRGEMNTAILLCQEAV